MTSHTTRRYAAGLAPYALVALCAVLPLAGCAGQGSVEDDSAARAAVRFSAAASADPQAACGLLAPQTRLELEGNEGPCPQALPGQDLPAGGGSRRAEVYGKDAIVHLEKDTVFLARFDDGWRVTAAGCTANGDHPYDCTVKAG